MFHVEHATVVDALALLFAVACAAGLVVLLVGPERRLLWVDWLSRHWLTMVGGVCVGAGLVALWLW